MRIFVLTLGLLAAVLFPVAIAVAASTSACVPLEVNADAWCLGHPAPDFSTGNDDPAPVPVSPPATTPPATTPTPVTNTWTTSTPPPALLGTGTTVVVGCSVTVTPPAECPPDKIITGTLPPTGDPFSYNLPPAGPAPCTDPCGCPSSCGGY